MPAQDSSKTYYCPWVNCDVSPAAARNCNNLASLENYQCKHEGTCVAKSGLEEFEKRLSKGLQRLPMYKDSAIAKKYFSAEILE